MHSPHRKDSASRPRTLRDWRAAHGYTLMQAVAVTGVPLATYWYAEAGLRQPSAETLIRLHERTGVPLRQLLATRGKASGSRRTFAGHPSKQTHRVR